MTPRQQKIHEEAKKRADVVKRAEWPLLEVLQVVLRERIHRAAGRANLYLYLHDLLGLSESSAASFSAVARKAIEVPRLNESLRKGLSVSKASRIVSVLTTENSAELLAFTEKSTFKEIDRKRAEINPASRKRASKKPVCKGWHRLAMDVSNETLAMFERAQELLSKTGGKPEDEIINTVFSDWLDRNDPVRKAARLSKKSRPPEEPTDDIPAYSRHVVNDRDKGACVLINENGHRCGETKYTDMHHIIERSEGGSHDPSNLRTLCAFHHRLVHQLKISRQTQRNWVPEPEHLMH